MGEVMSIKRMIFGAGFSGLAIARTLAPECDHLAGTTRGPARFAELQAAGLSPFVYDGGQPSPDLAATLARTTHLVMSISPDSGGDPLLDAFAGGLGEAMPALEWIGYLSTVGVYGDHGGDWVDEETPCRPVSRRSVARLAAEQGYAPAQINLGNFQGRLDEDGHLRIERIDLVDIFSLSPRDRFFKPLSWKVITGLEREWINGRERQVAHVNGGAGYATELAPGVQTFALAMARLGHNSQFSHDLEPAAGVLTGLLWHFEQHTARLELGAEKFANGVSRRRAVYRHGIALSAAHALSLEFERHWGDVHHTTRATLRYHYYYAP